MQSALYLSQSILCLLSSPPKTISSGSRFTLNFNFNLILAQFDSAKSAGKQQQSQQDQSTGGGKQESTTPPPPRPQPPSHVPSSSANRRGAPAFLHYAEPSLTAMQVRNEKEAELRANDEYWRKRLQQTEINLKQTNAVMEKEYNETISNVKKLFETAPSTFKPAPCETYRARLIACYKAFPGQTLECTKEVTDFTACVDQNRVDFLDSKYRAATAGAAAAKTK